MKDDADKRGTPRDVTIPPADRILIYERDARAAQMRRDGHTYEEIATTLGYSDKSHAYRMIKQRMVEARELTFGEADLYRIESIERLTALLRAVWDMAMAGSEKHVGRAMQIIKQMGELRGENLPIQVEIGMSDVDQLLRAAEQELGRRAAAAQVQAARNEAAERTDR